MLYFVTPALHFLTDKVATQLRVSASHYNVITMLKIVKVLSYTTFHLSQSSISLFQLTFDKFKSLAAQISLDMSTKNTWNHLHTVVMDLH